MFGYGNIPYHRDYKVSLQREKLLFRKKSLNAMSEAEVLKPAVQRKIEEFNRMSTSQVNGWSPNQTNYSDSFLDWPPVKKFPPTSPKIRKELEDPIILIHEKKISSISSIVKVLELALKGFRGKNLY